jgi:hypothetical protein
MAGTARARRASIGSLFFAADRNLLVMEEISRVREPGRQWTSGEHNVQESSGVQVGDYNVQINFGQSPVADSLADVGGGGTVTSGMAPQVGGQVIPSDLAVTLWGPTASGKTTYLGALNVAVAKASPRWTLTGADAVSTQALIGMTADLVGRGQFPRATADISEYRFVISGTFDAGVRSVPAKFDLSIVDPMGEFYSRASGFAADELVDNLERSNGIIFLFDPTREADCQDAYENFHGTAVLLENEMGIHGGERLPQHVAVCVAKCDDPSVYSYAADNDYLGVDATDPHGIPQVPEYQAKEFFDALYRKVNHGGGALLSHTIERYFYPDRIRYFSMSSVGFHLDKSGRFNADDYYNIVHEKNSPGVTRGDILPINVLEPLLWIAAPDIYAGAAQRRSSAFKRWAPSPEAVGSVGRTASALGATITVKPSHLICMVEVSGTGQEIERLDRIRQLVGVACEANSELRMSLISYGSHSVSTRLREWPVTVLAWDSTSSVLLRQLSNLEEGNAASDEYLLAAQIECALAEVTRRLSETEGRAALITAGSRPAFPLRMIRDSRTLPCPKRNDWRAILAELHGRGTTFGAIHDHGYEYDYCGRPVDTLNDIWAELGMDANATVAEIDIYRFAGALGLLSPDETKPYPPEWRPDRTWQYEEPPTIPDWSYKGSSWRDKISGDDIEITYRDGDL